MQSEKVDNLSPEWGIMLTLQNAINVRIGTQSWKKYINAAFWNYISTPINFTITLFTALSAGQTGTNSNFLSQDQLFYILFVSFVLSVINTFFKLKDKAILNYDALKQYEIFGSEFEKIYYTNVESDEDLKKKYNAYLILQEDINKYNMSGGIDNVNYATELIYLCLKRFFEDKMKRIAFRDRYWVLDGVPLARYPNSFPIDIDKHFRQDFSTLEALNGKKKVTFTVLNEVPEDEKMNEFLNEGPFQIGEKIIENMDRDDVNLSGEMVTKSPGAALVSTINIVKRPKPTQSKREPVNPVHDDSVETKRYFEAKTGRRSPEIAQSANSRAETKQYFQARSRTPSPETLPSYRADRPKAPQNVRGSPPLPPRYYSPAIFPKSVPLPEPPNIIESAISPSRTNSNAIRPTARKSGESKEGDTQNITFTFYEVDYTEDAQSVYDKEKAEKLRRDFYINMDAFRNGEIYEDMPIFKYLPIEEVQRYFSKYYHVLSSVNSYFNYYSRLTKQDLIEVLSNNILTYTMNHSLMDLMIGLCLDEVEANKIIFEGVCNYVKIYSNEATELVYHELRNKSQTSEEREREIKYYKNMYTTDFFSDDELFDGFINIKYGDANDPLEGICPHREKSTNADLLSIIPTYEFLKIGDILRNKIVNYKYIHTFFMVIFGLNYFESTQMIYNIFFYYLDQDSRIHAIDEIKRIAGERRVTSTN